MSYKVLYLKQAVNDFNKLDNSQKILVRKAIQKVSKNPVSIYDGGYGKPLGNRGNNNLSGYYKIKLLKEGLRIVYQLVKIEKTMMIIVIAARKDDEVYKTAKQRITNQK